MTTRIDAFIDRLQSTSTFDDLQELICSLRDIYDIDHAVYHSVGATGQQYALLTYSDDWVKHYIDQKYQRIDPVVLGALRNFHPFDWKQLDWGGSTRRDFMGEAESVGIGNQGYSVPIRGPQGQFALFSVNSRCRDDDWKSLTKESVRDFLLIGHYLHQKAEEIAGTHQEQGRELSPRERDALTLLSLGHSRAQAAEQLKISEHTFRVYVDTARHKLGATNTTHAVALAMSHGVILP